MLVFNKNPLRVDPTRTATIRHRFVVDLRRRFRKLRDAVIDFMVEQDALGLMPRTRLIVMVQPREFEFRTDPGKLQAFKEWLETTIQSDVLSGKDLSVYIKDAFQRGLLNAFFASKRTLELSDEAREIAQDQFLREIFSRPDIFSKLQLLGPRALEDLKGVTAQMATEMSRILVKGMIDGSSPDQIAAEMVERIDSLAESRALAIARTEVIAAHAEGQLDAFERLGVRSIGVRAEWSTAGDDRVCPQCSPMEGQTFTIEEARGLIPLHPNCRCSWIPSV